MMVRAFFLALAVIALSAQVGAKSAHFYAPVPNDQKINSPARIVSLAPVVTETLFLLGVGNRVVGVTRYCDRPDAAQKLPKVGGFLDPQLETILALKPDLVIGMATPNHQQVFDRLRERGIRVLVVFGDSIAEIRDLITNIGSATGRRNEALQFLTQFDSRLSRLKNMLAQAKAPRVMLVVAGSPLIVAGPGTFADEALALIGASSAIPRSAPAWPLWPVEKIVENPPDIIIATEGQSALAALKSQLAPILVLAPLRQTRVIASDKAILQRPGPYLVDDIEKLIKLLSPPAASLAKI